MEKNLTIPYTGIFGSGKKVLVRDYRNAAKAVRVALEALRDTSPHQRDYPSGMGAWLNAEREYKERLEKLLQVRDELETILAVIDTE